MNNFSLFTTEQCAEQIQLPDAALTYHSSFYTREIADNYLQHLIDESDWRQESVHLWGKTHAQPRLTAWYGDPGCNYSYSGLQLQALEWTETLREIKTYIETQCGHTFNSVLLNLYRDGNDHMGWHSDDEPELGENPVIASLSFGASRAFKLRHKSQKNLKTLQIELAHGSLLMMQGSMQQHWQHAIAKSAATSLPRINLTFRRIVKNQGNEGQR